MKLHFFLRFYTSPGQSLHISGNIPALGNGDPEKALPMAWLNHDFWQATAEVDFPAGGTIQYKYLLHFQDGYRVEEWGNDKEIPASQAASLEVIDSWNYAGEYENVFFTAPFQKTLLKERETKLKLKVPKNFTHTFKVKAPLLQKHEVACISGGIPALGEWNAEESVLMSKQGSWFSASVHIPREMLPLHYKYGVYNTKEKKLVRFEAGENRYLFGDAIDGITILHDGFVRLPNSTWHGAGLAVPVFSLRSKKSFGVGEFSDIKLMADWAKKAKFRLLQILPVNDTSSTFSKSDSYPYSAISAFALHPIYINLDEVAGKKYSAVTKALKQQQKELNALPGLDYVTVLRLKLEALKALFQLQRADFLADEKFQEFFEQHRNWLIPYAAFFYLRDRNGTADFSTWKINASYNKAVIEKYVSPKAKHYDDIALQYFIQYHLHLQLKEAADHVHKNGIILKGDIPIGIGRFSCDAWVNPSLYNMHVQAGAPPDGFATRGQNWGFPTYNWQEMEADGYTWWKRRFDAMSNYFDAFRIDHILGFFRIWSIPIEQVEGIMGYFSPAIPVYLVEFSERNIWFVNQRYTQPHITDTVLFDVFGNLAERVRQQFIDGDNTTGYRLKAAFNTQRKVEKYFWESVEGDPDTDRLRQGLYDLVSNVILFEVEGSGGTQFHFRFGMDQTTSFRHLEWNTQQQLKDLYVNYFFRRQDAFWKKEAMNKLPALKGSTNMLICGEDLGMVPEPVPDVMRQLAILSLEIQRMPKDPNKAFFHPNEAPYLSVVTPSTHDMSTIRGWWQEDPQLTQRFFNQELGQWGEAPAVCPPWISRAIILQHLHSPAMWSIFQLQDLLGMHDQLSNPDVDGERINIPADPRHYWNYRMHLLLEDLAAKKSLQHELKEYITDSGR